MNKKNTYKEIKSEILKQTKPFCITDLYHRINKDNTLDNGLVLKVLDELYDVGLVEYIELSERMGNTDYAFQVVENYNKQKIIK